MDKKDRKWIFNKDESKYRDEVDASIIKERKEIKEELSKNDNEEERVILQKRLDGLEERTASNKSSRRLSKFQSWGIAISAVLFVVGGLIVLIYSLVSK